MVRELRKDAKTALIVLLTALVVSQAIRINRANPPAQADLSASTEISALLHRACYNCHSNETIWPWYSNVAPVSWLVGSDVNEGRQLLNFSAWGTFDIDLKSKKLKKIAEKVASGEMPPWYYTLVHPKARLSPAERGQIQNWTAVELARLGRKWASLRQPGEARTEPVKEFMRLSNWKRGLTRYPPGIGENTQRLLNRIF